MFDTSSRYQGLETAIHVTADGSQLPYVRRRFLPAASTLQVVGQVVVMQSDRLDLIAARTLGVAELFWQVCDANDAMNPTELTRDAAVGTRLNIALPQATKGWS